MRSQVRVQGEPIYPVLGVLPLGIFATVVLFDFAALIADASFFATVGFWSLAGGVIVGVLVTGAGLAELSKLPSHSHDRRPAGINALLNAGMLGLFAMVWLSRWERHTLGVGALLLELVALGTGVAAAWLTRSMVTGRTSEAERTVPIRVPRVLR